ncbi:MAG TPA: DUF58 domain-containing protein [Steroidobacter sp.]|jgi:uncharacterized protein (DUF58 family)|nr:DUF58 domain-containing protein [Steroidobacteraceae bacterium]HLS82953.1 DUF58 domain-containing protein [Steroidobacter sp.]
MLSRLRARVRRAIRRWARRRHGVDCDPLVLPAGRIYILPTGLGVAFALMVFAMFLGAMNYANNLALALTFILGALGLTAMLFSHRNLAGVRIRLAGCEPVFAGATARFRVALENPAPLSRHELTLVNDYTSTAPVRIDAAQRVVLELELPAPRRGLLRLEHFEIASRHPFGLFRAWAHVHAETSCVVYPRPSERGAAPPPLQTDTGGAQETLLGDEDFAGLRTFHDGDSPRRIAWKAYARGQSLHTKVYAGTAVTSHLFDWDALPGLTVEARLSQLCRWIEDAHAAGRAYGLRMPGVSIQPNVGRAHRQRCLTALALFDELDA